MCRRLELLQYRSRLETSCSSGLLEVDNPGRPKPIQSSVNLVMHQHIHLGRFSSHLPRPDELLHPRGWWMEGGVGCLYICPHLLWLHRSAFIALSLLSLVSNSKPPSCCCLSECYFTFFGNLYQRRLLCYQVLNTKTFLILILSCQIQFHLHVMMHVVARVSTLLLPVQVFQFKTSCNSIL